jgi:hypothetical protein
VCGIAWDGRLIAPTRRSSEPDRRSARRDALNRGPDHWAVLPVQTSGVPNRKPVRTARHRGFPSGCGAPFYRRRARPAGRTGCAAGETGASPRAKRRALSRIGRASVNARRSPRTGGTAVTSWGQRRTSANLSFERCERRRQPWRKRYRTRPWRGHTTCEKPPGANGNRAATSDGCRSCATARQIVGFANRMPDIAARRMAATPICLSASSQGPRDAGRRHSRHRDLAAPLPRAQGPLRHRLRRSRKARRSSSSPPTLRDGATTPRPTGRVGRRGIHSPRLGGLPCRRTGKPARASSSKCPSASLSTRPPSLVALLRRQGRGGTPAGAAVTLMNSTTRATRQSK